MKKILTIMLSMLMVFSSCLMISAGTADIVATQSENGDLVITAFSDDAKTLIQKVYEGCGDRAGSGQITASTSLYSGPIMNVHDTYWDGQLDDRMYIEKDGDCLIVAKQTLIDGGFANGEYTLRLSDGESKTLTTTVTMNGLNDVKPNIASKLTLVGRIDAPVEGASTEIDESKFKLLNQDNEEISSEDFWIFWGEEGTLNGGEKTIYRTSDATFDINKTYYLVVGYSYVRGENDNTNVNLVYDYASLVKDEYHKGGGYTLGTYMVCEDYITYTLKCTVGKAQVKTSSTNDLSKDLVEKVAIKNSASQVQSLVVFDTDEEKALDAGKNVEIQMQVNSQSSVTKEDVTKVETKAASDGLTKGAIYDINLYTNIEGETNQRKVTETTAQTVISFPLEERLVNTDSSVNREYKVVRVHNGESEVLDAAYDSTTKSITFKTDKFSTYAICYKDSKKEEKKEESNTYSNTSSTKVVTCEEAMNSKNWTWSESKKACVYRVSNTSTK